jgi:UDP-N-acetylmuramate: L-alanyl-gamma-D-glutamyl-meso-diaminopimelate ligase
MNIHFISIGGSAMHNLALALRNSGHRISGSDDEIFEPSRSRLDEAGLLPENFGWFPEKISAEIDTVILGMHAKPDNPELLKAQKLNLNIVSYPEFIYNQSVDKKRIVIGGSHGKTTITSMIMHVLSYLNINFDYMVGSKIKGFDVMVRLSDAPIIVLEGDEYLSSPIDRRPKFHWYKPHLAVITGIAWDHINVFPTYENYKSQFAAFINLIEPGGKLFFFEGDNDLKGIVEEAATEVSAEAYGLLNNEIVDGITYVKRGEAKIPLQVFGNHNLVNMNAARLVCNELDIDDASFYEAIKSFDGASNRLELIAKSSGSCVFKDFAHAPSKVMATVKAVRQQFADKRFVACFELHTYSSLNAKFLVQYEGCLDLSDYAAIYFNPHALKIKSLPDLDTEVVFKSFANDKIAVFNDSDELQEWVLQKKAGNTVFLFMSSGDFDGIDIKDFSKKLI